MATTMAADNDDNEVDGDSATGDDDGDRATGDDIDDDDDADDDDDGNDEGGGLAEDGQEGMVINQQYLNKKLEIYLVNDPMAKKVMCDK